MKKIILLCVIGMFTLTACHSSTTTNSIIEATAMPSATVTPYVANTQKPTLTPAPSQEPDFESSDNIVEQADGYKRFNMTRTEFIERYNKEAAKYNNEVKNRDGQEWDYSGYITKGDQMAFSGVISDSMKAKGVSKVYPYELLTFNQNWHHDSVGALVRELHIYVDKDDKILWVGTFQKFGGSKEQPINDAYWEYFRIISSHMYLALLKTKTLDDFNEESNIVSSSGFYKDKQWTWTIKDITSSGFGSGSGHPEFLTSIDLISNAE